MENKTKLSEFSPCRRTRNPKGQPDKTNRVLQGKSPPSILSGVSGFSRAGFPLNVIIRHFLMSPTNN